MGQIRQYTSTEAFRGLQPSDLGIRATEEAARAMGQAGRNIGAAAEDIAEPLETSALSTEYAQTTAKLSQDTNAFFSNADPNDPDLYNKYKSTVLDPALEKFGSGPHLSAKAQGLAQAYRNDLQENYSKTAIGDQSTVAAGAVKSNLIQARNALSEGADADPTQHDHFQSAWNGIVEAQIQSHHLTAAQAAALREEVGTQGNKEIAVATARSMAERNPEQAKTDFSSGMFNKYLNGEEISTLRGYADTQQRASDTAQRAAEAEQRKQEDDEFHGKLANFYTTMEQPDGTLMVPPNSPVEIAKFALTPGGQRHPDELKSAMDLVARVANDVRDGKTVTTDPHTYATFTARMNLTDGDPNALTYTDINTARAQGLISDRDHSMFHQAIADNAKDPKKRDAYSQFGKQMSALRGAVTKSNILSSMVDSPGDQRYAEFIRYERTQMDAHFAKGDWQTWMDSGQMAKDAATKFAPGMNTNQDMGKPAPYLAPPKMGAPSFDIQHADGMRKSGNLDPWNRPVLHNADGSYSTTSSMSIGTDGGEVLIPTVVDGKRLSKNDAIAHYKKTGENFGTFDTPDHADKFATALHNAQAKRYDSHGTPLGAAPLKRNPGESAAQFLKRLGN